MSLWPGGEAPSYPGSKSIGGSLTVGGQILAASGTLAAPGISFAARPSNGWLFAGGGGNNVNYSQNGTKIIELGDTAFGVFGLDLNLCGVTLTLADTNYANPVRISRVSAGNLTIGGIGNGQLLGIKQLTELTSIAIASSTDTTILLPATALVLGVTVRVTVVVPTAATFTVGDAGSAARFSTAAVSTAANSTDPGTKAGAYYNATATAVRLTFDTPVLANTGRVRTTIHYLDLTPPTS